MDLSLCASIVMLVQLIGHGTSEANTTVYCPATGPKEVSYCHNDNKEVFRHDCSLTATGHALVSKQLPNQSWQAAHGLRAQAVLAGRPVCMEICVLQNQAHGL